MAQSTPGAGAKDEARSDARLPDPAEVGRAMAGIAERSQRLVTDWMNRQTAAGAQTQPANPDPFGVGSAFLDMTTRLMANPAGLFQAQIGLWGDYMTLWQATAQRMMGATAAPVIAADPKDKRFRDDAWRDNEVFDFIRQSYLLSSRFVQNVVGGVDGLDPHTARKVDFFSRQFVDAMSPSNFVLTNPEVLRRTAETGGENLLKGLDNMLSDLERGRGQLAIRMTDPEAFEIGRDVAISPGAVVFENELMQLIQYAPTTETVVIRPLLIVPPWINKFYILDLRPKNSFIRWAVAEGHTVFVVSWVNPDERLADKDFRDYMREGVLEALLAVERASGEREADVIGYCLGGTLLATTLAWIAGADRPQWHGRVATATFLTTLLDFSDAGDLRVFIDEDQIRGIEAKMNERGYLDGSEMSRSFNMLRANDLIWSFVINNYLLGQDPFPFDLLFWNGDSTRMPAAMHSFYLRQMYQANRLVQPGGIVIDGVPIDLGRITTPAYFLSTREDHIAPWRATYRGASRLGGPVRFALAASGHIAGVINPPAGARYSFWTNDKHPDDAAVWETEAAEQAGSWWPDWEAWLTPADAARVAARTPGTSDMPAIEPAPGRYVRVTG